MNLRSKHIVVKEFLLIAIKVEDGVKTLRYGFFGKKGFETKLERANSIEEILEKAGKSKPVVLHLTGFGVLTRIVENLPNYQESLIISGDKDDFYFNSKDFKNSKAVSFARKSLIEELVIKLTELKTYVWGIHIGPIPLLYAHEENEKIRLDYEIDISNNEIKRLEKIDSEKSEFTIQEKYNSALSNVCFNLEEGYQQGLSDQQFEITQSKFKEYKRFVTLGIFILSFFLLILLGNYFYVNHLNTRLAYLESEISSYGENLSMIDRLRQEKTRKQILVENSGVQGKTFLSFYMEKIGSSIPSSIGLSSMEVFPLIENLKPKMKVELNYASIVVHGFCANSVVLDDWMEKLEIKDWINGVELINYIRLSEDKSKFHLLIKLKK